MTAKPNCPVCGERGDRHDGDGGDYRCPTDECDVGTFYGQLPARRGGGE